MRVVVALGGNALLKRGEPMTAEVQRGNVKTAAQSLAPVAQKHQLVLSHGNGPQVGLLALQGAAYEEVDTYPLDVLGAQTEGMIGYMIEQELGNLLPFEVPFATILTMVEVDPDDPAFQNPTKFVGPVYSEVEASGALPITETDLRNPAHKMAAGKEHSRDLRRGWGYSHHVPEGSRPRSNRRRSRD
jgi:carbamate kinase